ncbi:MAG: glycosyltransferase family 4 protein [Nocardioides sp.]
MTAGAGRRLARKVRGRLRRVAASVRPSRPTPEGTPREVVEAKTNIGPVMDAGVARVRRRMLPAGIDADYDLAYEHFDVTHFLMQARHILSSDSADPIRHFLRNGAKAKASPEINFNMESYVARYPETATGPEQSPYLEWLKRGRAAGQIADPAPGPEKMAPVLGMQTTELVGLLAATRLDLQQRLLTGTLGEMFARAAEVEPLIGAAWPATTEPFIPPLATVDAVDQVSTIYSCQQQAGFARARLVIVAPEPRWGGGRRAEGHIAHALAGHLDAHDIVVIYTEKGGKAPPSRFPEGVREVDFASAAGEMDQDAAQRALVELVRSFRAQAVVNINSRLMYHAMADYGSALADTERLFLLLFCNEQLALGNWVGIPLRYFYRTVDVVEGVIADSDYLVNWLRERHKLGPEVANHLHVFPAPVDPSVPVAAAPAPDPARRRQVFWAGRWDRQKRVDIALAVARSMPDVDFRMWGEAVLTKGQMVDVPANVRLEGTYGHISELHLSEADVWLYTSAWDGVPSQLLEVAMTGVPIVGSLVGGTGEVLGDEDSWPVPDVEDVDAYVTAIRDVLADPTDARRRSAALRERMLLERTEAAYAERVAGLLLAGDRRGEGET